jgi:hypothetical protein
MGTSGATIARTTAAADAVFTQPGGWLFPVPHGECREGEDDQAGEDEVGRVREGKGDEGERQEKEPVGSQDRKRIKSQADAHDDAEDPPETMDTG